MNRNIAVRCQMEASDRNANTKANEIVKTAPIKHNPWSPKQRGLFGADLARKRAGKKTRTGMSEKQLVKALHEGVSKKKRRIKVVHLKGKK